MAVPPRAPWARVLAVVLSGFTPLAAAEGGPLVRPRPAPGRTVLISRLMVSPEMAILQGPDSRAQVVVLGRTIRGATMDLTSRAAYRCSDPAIVRVSARGAVEPQRNGTAVLQVSAGGRSAAVRVLVMGLDDAPPISFRNQIIPILTKLGCNAGGCHGKASGQNGFKLSLLGFDPAADYDALVREARGRRTFPADPDASLILAKPSLRIPHGGGRRFSPDGDDYRMIRRWIAAGMPAGSPFDRRVIKLRVWPTAATLDRGGRQQLRVIASFNDRTVEDVSRWAQYQSNEPAIAGVDGRGLVQAGQASGEAAVMARYMGSVTIFRAAIPLGSHGPDPSEFRPKNFIDDLVLAKLRALGIPASGLCTDAEFIRRASVDICGTLPTPDETRKFLADPAPDKRNRLVEALVNRPEYAAYFALKWGDVLHNKRRNNNAFLPGTVAFAGYIKTSLAQDKPYDRFVREILTASGTIPANPPVVWYREVATPELMVENTAQVFLGMRLQCAHCHHHPYEKWSQDDYYDLAAFFARVGRGGDPNNPTISLQPQGALINPVTARPAVARGLEALPVSLPPTADPRAALADWLTAPKNPFFSRAIVNRVWGHFLGRGLVEPIDDMRVTNPPTNPELLDALAADFVAKGFSLKRLVVTICQSRTYQLSSIPTGANKRDTQNYAYHYPQRMTAEVLLDALSQVTNVPTAFAPVPGLTVRRAIDLPDEVSGSYFLEVFGKPVRETACECERSSQANLAQSLHLINSDEIQAKVAAPTGRAALLARDPRPDAAKVDELFLWAYARRPNEAELRAALNYLAGYHAAQKPLQPAYENLIWALVNAPEFQVVN